MRNIFHRRDCGEASILKGISILLRRAHPRDAESRLALGHNLEIMRMFGVDLTNFAPFTEADAVCWINELIQHPHAWVIEQDGKFIGFVKLDRMDTHDARAYLVIGIYDSAKLGRGLGREVIHLILNHAFKTLKLHRVSLRVVSYNIRAIRCYQACGFVIEGCEREAAFVGDVRYDDIMMGILSKEFIT